MSCDNPSSADWTFFHNSCRFCSRVGSGVTHMGLITVRWLTAILSPSMIVWHDTIAVFGNADVRLRAVILTVCVHVVLRRAVVSQWCWHWQDDSWRASLLTECPQSWLLGQSNSPLRPIPAYMHSRAWNLSHNVKPTHQVSFLSVDSFSVQLLVIWWWVYVYIRR